MPRKKPVAPARDEDGEIAGARPRTSRKTVPQYSKLAKELAIEFKSPPKTSPPCPPAVDDEMAADLEAEASASTLASPFSSPTPTQTNMSSPPPVVAPQPRRDVNSNSLLANAHLSPAVNCTSLGSTHDAGMTQYMQGQGHFTYHNQPAGTASSAQTLRSVYHDTAAQQRSNYSPGYSIYSAPLNNTSVNVTAMPISPNAAKLQAAQHTFHQDATGSDTSSSSIELPQDGNAAPSFYEQHSLGCTRSSHNYGTGQLHQSRVVAVPLPQSVPQQFLDFAGPAPIAPQLRSPYSLTPPQFSHLDEPTPSAYTFLSSAAAQQPTNPFQLQFGPQPQNSFLILDAFDTRYRNSSFDPTRTKQPFLINFNGHVITPYETTLAAALLKFLARSPETVQEIIKFHRHDLSAPLCLAGFNAWIDNPANFFHVPVQRELVMRGREWIAHAKTCFLLWGRGMHELRGWMVREGKLIL